MRIAFVNPPNSCFPAPPLNLVLLGTIAARHHCAVQILDFDVPCHRETILSNGIETAVRTVMATQPEVIGFTGLCNNLMVSLEIAKGLRKARWGGFALFGGPHASAVAMPLLHRFNEVDGVLRGEADVSFPQLIDALKRGTSLKEVRGLSYRDGETIVENPFPAAIELAHSPTPQYELVDMDVYCDAIKTRGGSVMVEVGRGCNNGCSFCSTTAFWRGRVRRRPIEAVRDEIALIRDRWGVTDYTLVHDDIAQDESHLIRLAHSLKELGVNWGCSMQSRRASGELIQELGRCGCRSVFYGVESFSSIEPAIRRKNASLERFMDTLDDHQRNDIAATCSFIVGFPLQTRADIDVDVDGMLQIAGSMAARCQAGVLTLLPGSRIMDEYRGELGGDPRSTSIAQIPGNSSLWGDAIGEAPEVFPSFFSAGRCAVGEEELARICLFFNRLVRFFGPTLLELQRIVGLSGTTFVEWVRSLYLGRDVALFSELAFPTLFWEFIKDLGDRATGAPIENVFILDLVVRQAMVNGRATQCHSGRRVESREYWVNRGRGFFRRAWMKQGRRSIIVEKRRTEQDSWETEIVVQKSIRA